MSVFYQTNLATSDNQVTELATLSSILTQLQLLATSSEETSVIGNLQSILTQLGLQATAANQVTGNTTLSAISSAVSTAANQVSGNTTLSSILSAMATAANQTTGNTTLASILSGMSTAALQTAGNTSLTNIYNAIGSSTSAITSVTQTTSSTTLLAANANRKGFFLYNESGQVAFVSFGPTASSSIYTIQMPTKTGYESAQTVVYKGQITAIWSASGSAAMRITELS